MRIYPLERFPISGFAGIRERVLIQDRQYFAQLLPEEPLNGFGPLVYLASAWFLPKGSTGLHHHQQVDIVSVLPRGSMLHQGSIGHNEVLQAGEIQIQRSGEEGFSHNEINPHTQPQPFIQLWLAPIAQQRASYERVTIHPQGITVVESRENFELGLGHLPPGGCWELPASGLLFLLQGEATINSAAQVKKPQRGGLLRTPETALITADASLQFLYALLKK